MTESNFVDRSGIPDGPIGRAIIKCPTCKALLVTDITAICGVTICPQCLTPVYPDNHRGINVKDLTIDDVDEQWEWPREQAIARAEEYLARKEIEL